MNKFTQPLFLGLMALAGIALVLSIEYPTQDKLLEQAYDHCVKQKTIEYKVLGFDEFSARAVCVSLLNDE